MKMHQAAAAVIIAAATAAGLSSLAKEPGDAPPPYLNADNVPDASVFLAPPPASGSPLDQADKAIYKATREKKDDPRWKLATTDASAKPMDYFACAVDAQLSPDLTPKLALIMKRLNTGAVSNKGKDFFKYPRPFIGNDEPVCEADREKVAQSFDYPSGHTTRGWAEALILAELIPNRATQILARGRSFGESRAVCGVHTVSAVEAGYLSGAAAVAALHALPEFRDDMEAARKELAEVLPNAPKPDASNCQAEADALKEAPYSGKP